MFKFFLSLIILLFSTKAFCAISPKEYSNLNYRLIGFSAASNAPCRLEVALGSYNSEDSFEKNIIIAKDCKEGRVIAEVPYFGVAYTWRMTPGGNNKKGGELHHFATLPYILDTAEVRVRIISDTGIYSGYYFFVDINRTLYDMKGNPVWFLPPDDLPCPFQKTDMRDLKTNYKGTISYIVKDYAREIDYNGNLLLNVRGNGTVSGDSIEHYHHEIYFLHNGHYLIPGTETVELNLSPAYKSTSAWQDPTITRTNDGKYKQRIQFGTVIEYDSSNNIVWSWKSYNYFKSSDLFTHYLADGEFPIYDVHENAIYMDEKTNSLYVGFRDISRILKISYPDGKVSAVYGNLYRNNLADLNNDLFSGQHRIGDAGNGNIYVYNNNSLTFDAMPSLEVFKEVPGKKNSLKKIWQYDCTLDGIRDDEMNVLKQINGQLESERAGRKGVNAIGAIAGGNAIKMADGNYFISLSGQFGKMLIVDANKNVLWSAVTERHTFAYHWTFMSTYRASIVSPEELQRMIWNQK